MLICTFVYLLTLLNGLLLFDNVLQGSLVYHLLAYEHWHDT